MSGIQSSTPSSPDRSPASPAQETTDRLAGEKLTSRSLWAGLGASVGAFACCGGPMLLAAFGVGGGLAASLKAMAPLRPVFILLTVVAFGWSWWRLYRAAPACAPGEACPPGLRRQRRLLWIMAGIAALLVAFPWYAPALLK